MSEISLLISFGAGVISFLSPCVLPLVPVYLATLGGVSVLDRNTEMGFRTPLFHTLVFVAGFSIVFIALGAAAGLTGFAIGAHLETLHRIAGGLLVFFGLFLLASLKIPWLNYEQRLHHASGGKIGYTRSFLIGAVFSLGWTPCIGPILGGILTLAATSETAWQGAFLLISYSSGLGLPFVIISMAIGPMVSRLKRFGRYTPLVSLIGGLLLILVGALIFFDRLAWLIL
ncbi:MAG: cytochrome c biogenesis CcdA family protein [Dehalococcoidia bacterium]|nr:Thiol:disulfide interchange protein DsbD [Chloroflexota bacterium]MBT9163084.1 Thiol:disulfide interchange protein DsbD [Chloroflexota bacterium]